MKMFPSPQLLPLANLVKRLFSGGGKKLQDYACEVEEIAPAEIEHVPAAIYPPGTLERIRAAHPWSTLPGELENLNTRTQHAPIIRYEFENVLVHSLGLDTFHGGRLRIFRGLSPGLKSSSIKETASATYCMGKAVSTYFGHWLRDGCSTALLADPGEAIFLSPDPTWGNAPEYLEAFSLAAEPSVAAYVGRLTLFQDHAQGTSKQRRYKELRRRLRTAYPEMDDGPQYVYLRRNAGGEHRMLANEAALIDRLLKNGFDVVDVLGSSTRDLAYRLRSARMIVSMEGSHINHAYFCASDRASILLLIPADRFTLVHLGISRALRFGFGFSVVSPGQDGYMVEIEELMPILETLEKRRVSPDA